MLLLPTLIQGSTLELSSVPPEQLQRLRLGDPVSVNGVELSIEKISLENSTLSFSITGELFSKITFRGTSRVEFLKSNRLTSIIDQIKKGLPVIYEDYLFVGAEFITPELYDLLTKLGKLTVTLTELRAMKLGITEETQLNSSLETIKLLVSDQTRREDLQRDGDLSLMIAEYGNLKLNQRPAEGSITLCKLAQITQVGVGVRLENRPEYPRVTQRELEEYLGDYKPQLCEILSFCHLQTEYGPWRFFCFEAGDHDPHIVLVAGDIFTDEPVLTRVHSECYTGDVLHSKHCDCGEQLQRSLRLIQEYGRGVLIIPSGHEGRCIGLSNKVLAYRLQEKYKLGTYEANLKLGFPEDGRDFRPVRRILEEMGISQIRLLTGNPKKIGHLKDLIIETVPLSCLPNEVNQRYLSDKYQHHKKDQSA